MYLISRKKIITKGGAGEYGLSNVAHPWHSIINEAISGYAGKPEDRYIAPNGREPCKPLFYEA